VAVEMEMGHEEGCKAIQFSTVVQVNAIHVYAVFDPNFADKRIIMLWRRWTPILFLEHTSGYILDSRVADPYSDTAKPWATSPVEADRLCKLSEKLVG
jgi:hypothetical protein